MRFLPHRTGRREHFQGITASASRWKAAIIRIENYVTHEFYPRFIIPIHNYLQDKRIINTFEPAASEIDVEV